jgi:hypothetical protein
MAGPSNTDLMREIKAMGKVQLDQGKTLVDHESRIRQWERFKIAYDAADAALAKYRQEHPEAKVSTFNGINKDFVNIIIKFLGVISALLGLLYLIIQNLPK